jgi:hypothetical protein
MRTTICAFAAPTERIKADVAMRSVRFTFNGSLQMLQSLDAATGEPGLPAPSHFSSPRNADKVYDAGRWLFSHAALKISTHVANFGEL